jgi:integrase
VGVSLRAAPSGRLTQLSRLDAKIGHFSCDAPAKTRTRVEVPIHPDLEARLLAIASDNPRGFLYPTLALTRVDGRRGLSRQFAHLMSAAARDQDQVRSARNAFSRKSFHPLRHSFSSALANAGVSADVRMKLTGHKSLDVHRRYTHVEMEPLKHAIAALPRLAGENEA